jgi:hypothetical protein
MNSSPADRIWSSVSMTSSFTRLALPLMTTAIRSLGGNTCSSDP